MQYFHWYYPSDGSLWNRITKESKNLSDLGITALWIPPAYKAAGGKKSVGYDTYDLYDLGQFDQKGSIRTKYGNKDQLLQAVESAHQHQIQIYADVVFNHKGGADATEKIKVRRVHSHNRNMEYGQELVIEAWTKFTFPGRKGKYSEFTWNQQHFDGVDWAQDRKETAIFKILKKDRHWENKVDAEKGNYDYLMFADLDFNNQDVKQELKKWGQWLVYYTGIDGFRLDAVKHIEFDYFKEWLDDLRQATGKELFTVGEYWSHCDLERLLYYLNQTGERMSLFDSPLHHNFYIASKQGESFDLRKIFDNSLTSVRPDLSVTLVENHDTQPLQALEAPVETWFKPLAYALILLRQEAYPCVFYPDFYGATYTDYGNDGKKYSITLPKVKGLKKMLFARKKLAYGLQRNYINHFSTIGWTRQGNEKHPGSGLAVIMSNGAAGYKWMEIGKNHAGKNFIDILDHQKEKIQVNPEGWAKFTTNGHSVSVWIPELWKKKFPC